jgi:hypothetical protein
MALGLMLFAVPASASLRSDLDSLSHELDTAARKLCRSLDLSNCGGRATSKSQVRKTKAARPAGPAAAKPQDSGTPDTGPAANVPIPRNKPAVPVRSTKVATNEEGPHDAVPLPRVKPVNQMAALPKPASPRPDAPPKAPVQATSPQTPGPPQIDRATVDCQSGLTLAKVDFSIPATPASAGSCAVSNPVKLRAVSAGGKRLRFANEPVLSCPFAAVFVRWVTESADAVVTKQAGSPIATVSTGSGFECRGRNGDGSAKLSEHAFGNAIDLVSIATSDGQTINMADALDPKAKHFNSLRALRTTACGYFTTVLGPGANEAHKLHFHFDLGRHGNSDRYRICQ